jgi:hypothetical protein
MPRSISRVTLAALLLFLVLGPPVAASRSRVGMNEAATIGDLRTVITAQSLYSSVNGTTIAKGVQNFDGRLECLVDTKTCLPGYKGAPPLQTRYWDKPTRHGYAFTFHPGPTIAPETLKTARASASTVHDFAYVAVPVKPASKHPHGVVACLSGRPRTSTGRRGFCGDGTGRICYTLDGSPPPVSHGRCDPCPNELK